MLDFEVCTAQGMLSCLAVLHVLHERACCMQDKVYNKIERLKTCKEKLFAKSDDGSFSKRYVDPNYPSGTCLPAVAT